MIEGRDFQDEQMNYATQMVRQPGSTMKPIAAYLPAWMKVLFNLLLLLMIHRSSSKMVRAVPHRQKCQQPLSRDWSLPAEH